MSLLLRIFVTLCAYLFLILGVYTSTLWVIIMGSFLAGSSTTKLLFEILDERQQKANLPQGQDNE